MHQISIKYIHFFTSKNISTFLCIQFWYNITLVNSLIFIITSRYKHMLIYSNFCILKFDYNQILIYSLSHTYNADEPAFRQWMYNAEHYFLDVVEANKEERFCVSHKLFARIKRITLPQRSFATTYFFRFHARLFCWTAHGKKGYSGRL